MLGRVVDALVERRGPVVRCSVCGAPLFRGFSFISRGEVKLVGADRALVALDFSTTSRIALRHVDLSQCDRAAAG